LQVQGIEFSLVEKDVLFGLQQGNEVLKQLNKELDINKVEKLMDETREGIAYQEVCFALFWFLEAFVGEGERC